MAVAEMRKLNLAAMGYDRDAVLDALQRTGAAEIKDCDLQGDLQKLCVDRENVRERLTAAEKALEILTAEITLREKPKDGKNLLKDGFDVSYSEFVESGKKSAEFDATAEKIISLAEERAELSGELSKYRRSLEEAEIYSPVDEPLSDFCDGDRAIIKLGTVEPASFAKLQTGAEAVPLFAFKELSRNERCVLILAVFHKSAAEEGEALLSEAGFTAHPDCGDMSGRLYYENLQRQTESIKARITAAADEIYALGKELRPLKVYCDFLGYLMEKAEASDKMLRTDYTFLLQAYVPAEAEESVKSALDGVEGTVYYEFSQPGEEEKPPTLLKNNSVIRNFEDVTNMYSPPSSREFDPNTVMAVFYSLFLGFIMADVGYGLMMLFGGGAIYLKIKRDGGLKRMAGVFAVGGIFTIVWGILFNSFFGLSLPFMATLLPNAQRDMWSLVGIKVPAVLIISLILGCVQLCAGYFCKLVQCWHRGQYLDGLCDGLTWSVFTVGATLAICGFVEEFNMPYLGTVGGIIAGVGLLSAMLTAGRKEKIVGKFTKGFGAAYGVINFVSDILSYARLYGLMLSGAVIAQVVSGYVVTGYNGSTPLLFSGNAFLVIIGVILMIVGHVFNLGMSLLGAYIHDARLQYVEFYGRFFEGEGELFTPLGSKHKYIYLLKR